MEAAPIRPRSACPPPYPSTSTSTSPSPQTLCLILLLTLNQAPLSAGPHQICSGSATPFLLPTVAPCDDTSTAAAEVCLQPLATISGPATLLLCPGGGLNLAGRYTTAEGALSPRPLSFLWGAAVGTDNLGLISAHLAAHVASEVLELGAALLDGGDRFEFTLRVVDLVGQESAPVTHIVTRLATPAPVVTIEAPLYLTLSAGEVLLLPARAQLASCNGTDANPVSFVWSDPLVSSTGASYGAQVSFEWSATDVATGAALALPGASVTRSTLELEGAAPLRFGGTHLLRVSACLPGDVPLCGGAEMRVVLRDSPLIARLAGGDRAVGEDEGLTLDASASVDPNEPDITLHFAWSCSADAAFADAGPAGCPTLPVGASADPTLELEPGALPPGRFMFAVNVSKAGGETAAAGVAITIVAGSVPAVSVAAPAAVRQSASTALRLVGSASLDAAASASADDAALELAWSCDSAGVDLSDPLVSSTGASAANLVLRSGVLPSRCAQGACTYTFTLTTTHQAQRY